MRCPVTEELVVAPAVATAAVVSLEVAVVESLGLPEPVVQSVVVLSVAVLVESAAVAEAEEDSEPLVKRWTELSVLFRFASRFLKQCLHSARIL